MSKNNVSDFYYLSRSFFLPVNEMRVLLYLTYKYKFDRFHPSYK
jgi:hypothetical protein